MDSYVVSGTRFPTKTSTDYRSTTSLTRWRYNLAWSRQKVILAEQDPVSLGRVVDAP